MNTFKLLQVTETSLCRFLGFYSPWSIPGKYAIIFKLMSFIFYATPLIAFSVLQFADVFYKEDVSYLLTKVIIFVIVIEIYLLIYKYNFSNKNIWSLKETFIDKGCSKEKSSKKTEIV